MATDSRTLAAIGWPFRSNGLYCHVLHRGVRLAMNPVDVRALTAFPRSEEHTSELQSRSDLAILFLHDALPIFATNSNHEFREKERVFHDAPRSAEWRPIPVLWLQ